MSSERGSERARGGHGSLARSGGMVIPVYRQGYFVPALSTLLLAVAITFDRDGVRWFWADEPLVALVLLAMSAAFWLLLLVTRRRP